MTTTTKLLDTAAAAEFLGLREATLKSWRVSRKGPRFVKLGAKRVLYRQEDLETFIEAGINDTDSAA